MKTKRSADPTSDSEIRRKGIEVLNEALGPSGALRFLALLHRDATDYVEISRKLYADQTIEEIYERAQKAWNSEP